jgi:hypothetical protein
MSMIQLMKKDYCFLGCEGAVRWKGTRVLEEIAASIFRIDLTFSKVLPDYTASHPKRWQSSFSHSREPQIWHNGKKSSIFWDITLFSPLIVNRRFGETCLLHLRCQFTFNGLYGIIFQKIELFITTAVRTSTSTNDKKSVYGHRDFKEQIWNDRREYW